MLDRMPREHTKAEIVRGIEITRPSANGKLKVERLFSWQRLAGARGIYHHIDTGMAGQLTAACLEEGTNLHFAGERLAIENSGTEGALESGERTVKRVLTRA